MRARPLLALPLTALALAGCGGDDKKGAVASTPDTATAAAKPAATTATPAAATGGVDLKKKPKVRKFTGTAPKKLTTRDIVKGKGAVAKDGDLLTVQYVGVLFKGGKQFDASWDNGQPFQFPLGAGQVIPGWDRGIKGMRVGGRRELVIPPGLAYGPQAQAGIPASSTLVFVVDLQDAQAG